MEKQSSAHIRLLCPSLQDITFSSVDRSIMILKLSIKQSFLVETRPQHDLFTTRRYLGLVSSIVSTVGSVVCFLVIRDDNIKFHHLPQSFSENCPQNDA
ncbi:hypothetical protein NPIL_141921 [Nephila pilipes]|uniref:Uncharacterized protein n=1 Tax=Nephila pilipes TaxID=299642 RepID=A0A8X6MDE5_NEPPI|nr:hypothetical protein NPIL_141921 [Nephila pilipes]